jgi:hypothetical protein
MAKSFAADVSRWADLSQDKLRRVMQASIQDVMTIAQTTVAQGGNMPVDTGFLRNSLVSSLDGASVAQGEDSYTLTIGQMQVGQTARFAWAAEYAAARHYKGPDFGQGGGMWRDLAAQQWQRIVESNAKAVQ